MVLVFRFERDRSMTRTDSAVLKRRTELLTDRIGPLRSFTDRGSADLPPHMTRVGFGLAEPHGRRVAVWSGPSMALKLINECRGSAGSLVL
jgi:hypothetical protein